MNLVTCAEDCEYQKDGYCRLGGSAPVSAVRVNGCSYYKKKKKETTPSNGTDQADRPR